MAMFESPEILESTKTMINTSQNDSDLNLFSLRRRTTTTTDAETRASDPDDSRNDSTMDDRDRVKSSNLMSNVGENTNEIPSVFDIRFTYQPCIPTHRRIKESPLSSDAIFKQSHAGQFNLCRIVFVAVNNKLIIENLMKVVVFLQVIISRTVILYPIIVILRCDSVFLSDVALMLFACIVWLKLVSYAHTNNDMKKLAKSAKKTSYPHNLKVYEAYEKVLNSCWNPSVIPPIYSFKWCHKRNINTITIDRRFELRAS